MLSWLISDVPNDDPGVIGSGPTVADRTTFADALAVLAKYRIEPPAAVRAHLEAGAAGKIEETPKPGDPRLARVETVIGRDAQALARSGRRGRARKPGWKSSCWATISKARRASSAPTHARQALEIAQRAGKPT